MSKLFEKIECFATGHRTPMPRNFAIETEEHVSVCDTTDHLETFRFIVRIGTDMKMPAYRTHEDLQRAKDFVRMQAVRYMQQWVFGEFVELVEEARHAVYNHDRDGAIQALEDLQRRMTRND